MQMVKNFFIGIIVFLFAIVLFMPKQELYFKLENYLSSAHNIKINEKKIEENLFSLSIYDADIYVKGLKIAKIEKIDFFSILFYNTLTFEQLSLDKSLKSIASVDANATRVNYAIWNPLQIAISSKGSFGGAKGQIEIKDKHLRVDFNDSSEIQALKSKLKKDEKGWYYEASF